MRHAIWLLAFAGMWYTGCEASAAHETHRWTDWWLLCLMLMTDSEVRGKQNKT